MEDNLEGYLILFEALLDKSSYSPKGKKSAFFAVTENNHNAKLLLENIFKLIYGITSELGYKIPKQIQENPNFIDLYKDQIPENN